MLTRLDSIWFQSDAGAGCDGSVCFRPQHLSGLQLVSDLCSGSLQGATIGSTDISLTPGKVRGGSHTADTQTAG